MSSGAHVKSREVDEGRCCGGAVCSPMFSSLGRRAHTRRVISVQSRTRPAMLAHLVLKMLSSLFFRGARDSLVEPSDPIRARERG